MLQQQVAPLSFSLTVCLPQRENILGLDTPTGNQDGHFSSNNSTSTLSYRPGSINVKPDALSLQFVKEQEPSGPDSMLPSQLLVATAWFAVEQEVLEALHQHPSPGNEPRGKLFVPVSVHFQVLQWAHASRLTRGGQRTLASLR